MTTTKPRARAVLDTNIFVSGFFSTSGTIAPLQELWKSGAFQLAVSEEILNEVKATFQKPYLQEKFRLSVNEVDGIIALIREKSFIVTEDKYRTDRIIADPNDNKFLGCALEAKAYYVVSGDSHLLSLKHFHGIQSVDAATFIKKITEP